MEGKGDESLTFCKFTDNRRPKGGFEPVSLPPQLFAFPAKSPTVRETH